MTDDSEKEWNPENEKLDDEYKREHIAFMRSIRKEMEEKKKKEAEGKAPPSAELRALRERMEKGPGIAAVGRPWVQPNFEDISRLAKKAWEGTKAILSDAPVEAQGRCFELLMQVAVSDFRDEINKTEENGTAAVMSGPGVALQRAQPAENPAPALEALSPIEGLRQSGLLTDFLEIWTGHLRRKRSPVIFAEFVENLISQDPNFHFLFHYLAGKPWREVLLELRSSIAEANLQFFDAPEAEGFFEQWIEQVGKWIERGHKEAGLA